MNGWDIDVLQTAIDQCTNDSGRLEDCVTSDNKPVFDFFTNEECQACKLPTLVDEQIDGTLDQLPGCNPLTYGPERAQPVPCVATPIGAGISSFADLTGKREPWEYVGCGADDFSNCTLEAASINDKDMTVERCVDFCGSHGYRYAGLEYSSEYVDLSFSLSHGANRTNCPLGTDVTAIIPFRPIAPRKRGLWEIARCHAPGTILSFAAARVPSRSTITAPTAHCARMLELGMCKITAPRPELNGMRCLIPCSIFAERSQSWYLSLLVYPHVNRTQFTPR